VSDFHYRDASPLSRGRHGRKAAVRGRKRKAEDGSRSREPAAEKGKSLTFILSLLERERQKSSYGER